MSSPLPKLASTTTINIEDHQVPLACADMRYVLRHETRQLLKTPTNLKKLPYRLVPRPLPDQMQLCKLLLLALPAQPQPM